MKHGIFSSEEQQTKSPVLYTLLSDNDSWILSNVYGNHADKTKKETNSPSENSKNSTKFKK